MATVTASANYTDTMRLIQTHGHCAAVLLFLTTIVACGSSSANGTGGASNAGGTSASIGGSAGTGGNGGQGTTVVLQDNHCVMKVSGTNINIATYNVTGPLSTIKGTDTVYDRTLDKTGFYCVSGAPSGFSVDIDIDVSGQLDQQVPYSADETTGNYIDVGFTYSLVPSSLDETKRQWWSCHAGKDQISNSGAKGNVGQFSIAFDGVTAQSFAGGKPYDYVVHGTMRAECPPYTPDPSEGIAGTGTAVFEVTLD